MKRLVFAAILGTALLFAAAPAMAQIGDLAGTTPCCDKVCTGSTSTKCGDLVAGGLSQMLSGCAGIDDQFPATCAGGQLLDAGDSALLDGCLCVLGTCVGPLAAGGAALTHEQCTAASVAACQETGNVVVTENDADCAVGPCNNDGTCDPGETFENCPADCLCGNGVCDAGEDATSCFADCHCGNGLCDDDETTATCPADCPDSCGNGTCDAGEDATSCFADCHCGNGVCDDDETTATCPGDCPGTCSEAEQPCPNGKSECCAGLQCVDNSAVDHRKVCRHGH